MSASDEIHTIWSLRVWAQQTEWHILHILFGTVSKWVQTWLHLYQDTLAEAVVGAGVLMAGQRVQGLLARRWCYCSVCPKFAELYQLGLMAKIFHWKLACSATTWEAL